MIKRLTLVTYSYHKAILIVFFLFIGTSLCEAQSTAVDSLQSLLKKEKDPCALVDINIDLMWEFLYEDSDIAESYALKSVEISKKCSDKIIQSNAYSTLATIYLVRNQTSESLKYFFIALKLKEEMKNLSGIAVVYNNIGIAYRYLDDYDNALRYYNKSLKITLGLNRNPGDDYTNIALCYFLKKEYLNSIETQKRAINQYIKHNDSTGLPGSYLGLAEVYLVLDSMDLTVEYLTLAEKLSIQLGQSQLLGGVYVKFSRVYSKKSNFKKALEYAKLGYTASSGSNTNFDTHQEALKELSIANYNLGNMSEAYKFHVEYSLLKDSLMNQEKIRDATTLELNYNFEKEQFADSLLHQDEIHAEQQKTATEKLKASNQRKLNWLLIAIGGLLMLSLIGAFIAYRNKRKSAETINIERQKSEELLLNILPVSTAEELKSTGISKPRPYESVSILFTDFKGFTMAAEKLTAEALVYEIDHCFKAFDEIIGNYPIEKIKTIGDAYMCAGGLPSTNDTHPIDMVNAALDIRDWMLAYKKERELSGKLAFEIRIGVHSGPVVSGIVGTKKFAYDIWGDTVNTASRMESSGEVGKVNISGTTHALIENSFKSEHRGKIEAKNKGQIDMYFVEHMCPVELERMVIT